MEAQHDKACREGKKWVTREKQLTRWRWGRPPVTIVKETIYGAGGYDPCPVKLTVRFMGFRIAVFLDVRYRTRRQALMPKGEQNPWGGIND